MDLLSGLNAAQQRAVTTTDGPLLIVAGAGAGKTKTVTHRIAHLIASGVTPEQILAVTFTNKAAREMRERVGQLLIQYRQLDDDGRRPMIATFHALCVRLLKEHAHLAGLPRHFTIYDRSDAKRTVKQAMQEAGWDVKQTDPGAVLGTISWQKGQGVRQADYAAEAGNQFFPRLVADVWQRYQAALQREGAVDFDDLLVKTRDLLEQHEDVRMKLRERFRYIHVDEYQDTNTIQEELLGLLVGQERNICVVGDTDQCLAAGARITMADGTEKHIEDVTAGEHVLSNYGSGDMRPAQVLHTHARTEHTHRIRIHTESGRTITSTPEHMHFAGYVLGATPHMYFTYLMYKHGHGFRLGTSQMYTRGQRESVAGFKQRCRQEHADAVWVIATHDTENAARIAEYTLSLQYRIPTLPFVARKGRRGSSANGYVHDQDCIDTIYSTFDTETSGAHLLTAYGLSRQYPHYWTQSEGRRQHVLVTMCGDRRSASPMHRVSFVSQSATERHLLEQAGFSVRPAKGNSDSWRFETAHKHYGEALRIARALQETLGNYVSLMQTARVCANNSDAPGSNALPFMPAASIQPGMALCDHSGKYDVVAHVERFADTDAVYDLDIESTHNFIANGIVTHNSVYTWRGARPDNMLSFEQRYPGAQVVTLEENYRSSQTILGAANELIGHNENRFEKQLRTQNAEGEKIGVYAASSEREEARFIIQTIQERIAAGVPADEIAVLYRANFQSRILEEHLLHERIPYQVVGTKFFERKEVKDVLAFLRAALAEEPSVGDLSRIINVPPRGIGKATLGRVIGGTEDQLGPAAREKVAAFRRLLADIRQKAHSAAPSETIQYIAQASGMEAQYAKGTDEEAERLENIRELVTLAAGYDDQPGEAGIEAFLEHAALATDQDTVRSGETAVRLMTVHAAKGLEFDTVFISGLEEDLFPHAGSEDKIDPEEERRLFYVALTRARRLCYLTYASVRTIYGSQRVHMPSSFFGEIDEGFMEPIGGQHGYGYRGEQQHRGLLDEIEF